MAKKLIRVLSLALAISCIFGTFSFAFADSLSYDGYRSNGVSYNVRTTGNYFTSKSTLVSIKLKSDSNPCLKVYLTNSENCTVTKYKNTDLHSDYYGTYALVSSTTNPTVLKITTPKRCYGVATLKVVNAESGTRVSCIISTNNGSPIARMS